MTDKILFCLLSSAIICGCRQDKITQEKPLIGESLVFHEFEELKETTHTENSISDLKDKRNINFGESSEALRPEPQIQSISEKSEVQEKIELKTIYNEERSEKMELILSSTLGTIFYTITVFVAGALVGAPLWNWISSKLPWNK
jgi:hypothetical protein